jgi:hypothetical protein
MRRRSARFLAVAVLAAVVAALVASAVYPPSDASGTTPAHHAAGRLNRIG